MDLVDFIRHNFSDLYKKRPDPCGPSAVKDRVVKMNEKRRGTRLETICEKRKIPVDMSPYVTPGPKRIRGQKKEIVEKPVDQATKERLEMLSKWKEEKAKKKQEERNKRKPMFKVTHVPVNVGLPNLENVNMEIKGKRFKSKFAPPNHKFKPPANIKPLHFENKASNNNRTVKEKSFIIETQVNRMVTRSQALGHTASVPATSLISMHAEKKLGTTSKKLSKKNVQMKTQDLNDSMSPDYPITDKNITDDKTPKKTNPPVYVSPFVTISRGKNSARKEYEARKSGKSFGNVNVDASECTSPKAGAAYFTWILNNQILRLEKDCQQWIQCKDDVSLPEEAISMIDVAIGQANLFITKKCVQFRGLIDKCKENDIETPVTCADLHGFWDMMLIQVNNLDKRFENLVNLKTNNWMEIVPEVKKVEVRKKGRIMNKTKASSALKEAIHAARRKNQNKNDEGIIKEKTPQNRRSNRISQLIPVEKSKKRLSSPGLMMMKVGQYAKTVETPAKSILKTEKVKSGRSHSKSVLFKEDVNGEIVNNENDLNKSNSKAKTPSRTSTRLSRNKLF